MSTASKFTEMPPHLFTSFTSPSRSITKPHFNLLFLKPFSSSSSTAAAAGSTTVSAAKITTTKSHSSSWLNKWPGPPPPRPPPARPSTSVTSSINPKTASNYAQETSKGTSAIERIVLRLRNLGLGSDDENDEEIEDGDYDENSRMSASGEEKLGDLLKRDWVRPDTMLMEDDDEGEDGVLPWEREEKEERVEVVEERGMKRRIARAPSLAELTIEDEELRRLRRDGMTLRERVSVPKAGVTNAVLEKIHDQWRKNELVRLKFHEVLARDMKTAHEIVERRSGGLVIWRSGSVMVVYRGSNYQGPFSRSQPVKAESDNLFVPDVSSPGISTGEDTDGVDKALQKSSPALSARAERMSEEESEFNKLLDGLGPRFEEWWGTGILPVDADLLPQTIPGYKTPFRLLPTGMRPRLTNAEMTNLRKLAKSLPIHFALGRNRHHQGLAAAIIKLWEKSLVVKIAVKRGIQNTNNKLMADEIKMLTGGVLLLRNKYYIVMYRGKDFLPPTVAAALTERSEITKQIQDVEEKVRIRPVGVVRAAEDGQAVPSVQDVEDEVRRRPVESVTPSEDGQALAGTLAEFYEAQARWGREISSEEHAKMIEEASRAKTTRVIKRIEHKLGLSQAKKLKAEKILSKIVASWLPAGPSDDLETITDEERVMYRRVGLRMKAYLPLGIRGVFDGVIENMHLHWKHRELVKLISKEKELAFVEETARLLEYESGGILVAIERVPKGFAVIFYRGKNYRRPISIRPRNLLTKAKALKRRVALQRYEALSQHISDLERTIEQTKRQIGESGDVGSTRGKAVDHTQLNQISELQSEDENAWLDSSDDEDDDFDGDDSDFSSFEDDDFPSSEKE